MSSIRRQAADEIHSAAIHLLRRVAREDAGAGVSPPRMSALSVLVFTGPKTISELAAMERVKLPTMSRLVAAMEEEGLARREPHARDGRVVTVHVTAKGRRTLERGRELRLRALEALLGDADAREVAVIREAAKIVDRLVL
ncbi:MAG TPA: MarR family transcriptional regulator [Gaiellaceae bacterium]|nr:MarR family transcriptional regulator [Gaiellaceae bacterium]